MNVTQLKKDETNNKEVYFRVRTAHECVEAGKNITLRKMLGNLWLEGELVIFFSSPGLGKTILAVQAADAISKGRSVDDDFLVNDCEPKSVLLLDFELNDIEFAKRYNSPLQTHQFSKNFLRADINPEFRAKHFGRRGNLVVMNALKSVFENYDPDVVIIDNISFLHTESTQDTNIALEVMNFLKDMKEVKDISILVIGHTTKIGPGLPLSLTHLAGSAHLSNFVTSIFGLNKTNQDFGHVYIKQLKGRNVPYEDQFNEENVLVAKRIVREDGILSFSFVDCMEESRVIWYQSTHKSKSSEREELAKQCALLRDEGNSLRDIGKKIGKSHTQVKRLLAKYDKDMAKEYSDANSTIVKDPPPDSKEGWSSEGW